METLYSRPVQVAGPFFFAHPPVPCSEHDLGEDIYDCVPCEDEGDDIYEDIIKVEVQQPMVSTPTLLLLQETEPPTGSCLSTDPRPSPSPWAPLQCPCSPVRIL